MNPRYAYIRVAIVLCVIMTAAAAYAQFGPEYRFTLAQQVTMANTKMPAGTYTFAYDGSGGFVVRGGENQVRVPVVTRLAQLAPSGSEPRLVLDKLDTGEQMLSEIWLPGQDGFLVCTLEKQHHHVTVKGQGKGTDK